MKSLLITLLLAGMASYAQTTVTDTVYVSAGVTASGYIVITPSRTFTASGGQVVAAVPTYVVINPLTGVFTVPLYATTTGVPVQTFYTARFYVTGAPAFSQQWTVPVSATPVNLAIVNGPNRSVVFLSQFDTTNALSGYCITFTTTADWRTCPGGSAAFSAITSGTNTTATMTVGSGGTFTFTGSGIVNANRILGVVLSTLTGVLKANSGVLSVVTGSAGDCVHVDGSSAPCGSASTALQGLGTITTSPVIDGGSTLTTKTIGATLGANITCGAVQNFTAGQFLLLSLTQDGTGSRSFTCAALDKLGDNSQIPAGKNTKQVFIAVTSATLQAWTNMWCVDCSPAIGLPGSVSGVLTIKAAAATGTNTLTFPAGTVDFSATGGPFQFVKQASAGGPLTVVQPSASDLSNGVSGSGAVCLATGSACGGGSYDPSDATKLTQVDTWCVTGVNSQGFYGDLEWGKLGPSGTVTAAMGGTAARPCAPTFTSDASNNTEMELFQSAPQFAGNGIANSDFRLTMRLDVVTNVLAGIEFFPVGTTQTCQSGVSANCVALLLDTSVGATFRGVVCSGSTCTQATSSITPVANTTYTLRAYVTTAGTWNFAVNGETPFSIATNVPSTALVPKIVLRNLSASAHVLTLLRYYALITGLTL